jgi:hypothetical protein
VVAKKGTLLARVRYTSPLLQPSPGSHASHTHTGRNVFRDNRTLAFLNCVADRPRRFQVLKRKTTRGTLPHHNGKADGMAK